MLWQKRLEMRKPNEGKSDQNRPTFCDLIDRVTYPQSHEYSSLLPQVTRQINNSPGDRRRSS